MYMYTWLSYELFDPFNPFSTVLICIATLGTIKLFSDMYKKECKDINYLNHNNLSI